MWAVVAWLFGLPGIALNVLLLSGFAWTAKLGRRIGALEIKIGNFTMSLVVMVTSVCMLLFVGQHMSLHRISSMTTSRLDILLQDKYLKDRFRIERNWWMSGCCLCIWVTTWRLTVMHRSGLLQVWNPRFQWRLKSRAAWICLAIVIFLVGDLPVSRAHYWFQMSSSITPNKVELTDRYGDSCTGVFLKNCVAGKAALCPEKCNTYCKDVRVLATDRQNVVHWVRNSHVTGKWGAQIFDGVRGVEQTSKRVDALFESKSCSQVLQSVDKSNFLVNVICMSCAVVVFFLLLWALAHVFEGLGGPAVPIIPAPEAPANGHRDHQD